ncbi:MAG: glycosyl hydrolase family 3, partial [Prochlorococcus sp.]
PYLWDELTHGLDTGIPAVYSPGQMPEAQRQALSYLLKPAKVHSNSQPTLLQEFTD